MLAVWRHVASTVCGPGFPPARSGCPVVVAGCRFAWGRGCQPKPVSGSQCVAVWGLLQVRNLLPCFLPAGFGAGLCAAAETLLLLQNKRLRQPCHACLFSQRDRHGRAAAVCRAAVGQWQTSAGVPRSRWSRVPLGCNWRRWSWGGGYGCIRRLVCSFACCVRTAGAAASHWSGGLCHFGGWLLVGQAGCASLVAGFSLVRRAVPVCGWLLGIRTRSVPHGRKKNTTCNPRGLPP
jgi:hypothetical protein